MLEATLAHRVEQGSNSNQKQRKSPGICLSAVFQGVGGGGQGWLVSLPEVTREGSLDYKGLRQRGKNGRIRPQPIALVFRLPTRDNLGRKPGDSPEPSVASISPVCFLESFLSSSLRLGELL